MSRSAEPRRGKSGAGLIPARQITSDAAALSPKGTSSVDAARPNRTRSMLVGLQAAASLLLLVTAGLLTRGMMQATRVDIGFASDSLLLVSPAFGRRAVEEQTASYWSAALDSIRALPDVRGVSRASFPPYLGASKVTIFKRAGSRYVINHNETDPEYFTVIGLRVVRRRTYTRDEAAAGANVAVISESLARDFFPGEDPLGQSLERVVPGSSRIVVGVVSNAITSRLRELSSAAIYEPLRAGGTVRLVVRSEGPPEALIPAVRTALNQIDPRIRVVMQSVGDAVRRQLAEPRTLAALVGVMAGIALTLAIVGIYGVTAFVVKQRTHEISVQLPSARRAVTSSACCCERA